MKLNKIDEVWNIVNLLFEWIFCLLSSQNFSTMAMWGNDFSSLLHTELHINTQLWVVPLIVSAAWEIIALTNHKHFLTLIWKCDVISVEFLHCLSGHFARKPVVVPSNVAFFLRLRLYFSAKSIKYALCTCYNGMVTALKLWVDDQSFYNFNHWW